LIFDIFSESSAYYVVPEWRTYPKASLLTSKMMLVVIFLQLMEETSFTFAGIYMMEAVVGQVIGNIAETKAYPEESE
jgi:hypothetical protein